MPPVTLVRTYERFWELPVPMVLTVLWVAGAALGAAYVVTLWEVGSVLARALAQGLMRSAG